MMSTLLSNLANTETNMTDLSTTYLGLELQNPLVASASPLSKKLDGARKLEDAGVAAIVMYSLFEEQVIHESLELDHYLTSGSDAFSEAMSYLPDAGTYSLTPDKYLEDTRYRQFERRLQRRLDALRPPHSGCGCGRAGTKSVFYGYRSQHEKRRCRVCTGGIGGGSKVSHHHSARCEIKPIHHIPAELCNKARPGGSRWSGFIQSLLPA